jgi:hypothetical protein
MGVALVSSLKQQGITDTVVPASSLVIFLLIAALLGLIAASWPARRAARLDILNAIAAQLCAHRGGSHRAQDMHHRSFRKYLTVFPVSVIPFGDVWRDVSHATFPSPSGLRDLRHRSSGACHHWLVDGVCGGLMYLLVARSNRARQATS